MSMPWMRKQDGATTSSAPQPDDVPILQDESSDDSNLIRLPCGGLKPPKINNPIDFTKLSDDTRGMRIESKKTLKDSAIKAGVKESSEKQKFFDDFCEKNIKIYDRQGMEIRKGPGVPKELERAITDPRIVNNLRLIGVQTLNPLQQQAVKIMQEGLSLLLQGPTGIGKTYAFLIPAIKMAQEVRKELGKHKDPLPSPSVFVLSTTGRLATQTYNRCLLMLGLQCQEDVQPVREIFLDRLVAEQHFRADQLDIAIATMGKLKATIEAGGLGLQNVKMIILDEADKMTDESSFGEDVRWLLSKLSDDVRANLQVGMFSATYLETRDGQIQISELQSDLLLNNPFQVLTCPRMPGYITQRVIRIPECNGDFRTHEWIAKMSKIHELLDEDLEKQGTTKDGPFSYTVIIFCETVQMTTMVTMALCQVGFKFRPMSRIIMKDMQEVYLNELANCEILGLVCTNIMARGIDVPSVKHTIVMEMSTEFAIYKHRIGRVGRDGSGGLSTVFLDSSNIRDGRAAQIVEELVVFMGENGQDIDKWLADWYDNRMKVYRTLETQYI